MYSPDSSILDFYPTNFESDLNGKKQEWEAIVKIPFLDQKRLLKAMSGESEQENQSKAGLVTHIHYTFRT